MTTRAEVLEAVRSNGGFEAAAHALGIAPGRAYLIATGTPADGSVAPGGAPERPPGEPVSPQRLVNDAQHNPLSDDEVSAWVRSRARRDLASGD